MNHKEATHTIDEARLWLLANIGELAENCPRLPGRTLRALVVLATIPQKNTICRVLAIAKTHTARLTWKHDAFANWLAIEASAACLLELLPEDPTPE